jgi:nucleoid-associated protein YgaU
LTGNADLNSIERLEIDPMDMIEKAMQRHKGESQTVKAPEHRSEGVTMHTPGSLPEDFPASPEPSPEPVLEQPPVELVCEPEKAELRAESSLSHQTQDEQASGRTRGWWVLLLPVVVAVVLWSVNENGSSTVPAPEIAPIEHDVMAPVTEAETESQSELIPIKNVESPPIAIVVPERIDDVGIAVIGVEAEIEGGLTEMLEATPLEAEVDVYESTAADDLRRDVEAAVGSLRDNREPTPEPNKMYRVKDGDSLSGIAYDVYGDHRSFDRIYDANRNVIANPDELLPGQELIIPQ